MGCKRKPKLICPLTIVCRKTTFCPMDYTIPSEAFVRIDESDDEIFYSVPRLVKHIDETACTALTTYLSSILQPNSHVLDLMASCASHLPEEINYGGVVGLGMNQTELNNNPQLTLSLIHISEPTRPY